VFVQQYKTPPEKPAERFTHSLSLSLSIAPSAVNFTEHKLLFYCVFNYLICAAAEFLFYCRGAAGEIRKLWHTKAHAKRAGRKWLSQID
jgi:hypothetical protein